MHIVGEEGVDVAADDHGIGHTAVADALEEPRAIGRVTVPIVGPERVDAVELLPELRHQHVPRDHIPLRLRVCEPRMEPGFLGETHHGAAGVEPFRAARVALEMAAALVRRAVAGLARAILPAVDHGYLDPVSEA